MVMLHVNSGVRAAPTYIVLSMTRPVYELNYLNTVSMILPVIFKRILHLVTWLEFEPMISCSAVWYAS